MSKKSWPIYIAYIILHVFPSSLLTVCPRSSDPFYIVSHYIKWVPTSWTYSNFPPYEKGGAGGAGSSHFGSMSPAAGTVKSGTVKQCSRDHCVRWFILIQYTCTLLWVHCYTVQLCAAYCVLWTVNISVDDFVFSVLYYINRYNLFSFISVFSSKAYKKDDFVVHKWIFKSGFSFF